MRLSSKIQGTRLRHDINHRANVSTASRKVPITLAGTPSMVDRPFGAPPAVTVLELPCPPSVNRIWRNNGTNGTVSRAREYTDWIKQADMAMLVDCAIRGRRVIEGAFTARIEVKRPGPNSDIDNRIKAVLDYAQSRGFIANDKHLVSVTACWSDVSTRGCRLTLTEVSV